MRFCGGGVGHKVTHQFFTNSTQEQDGPEVDPDEDEVNSDIKEPEECELKDEQLADVEKQDGKEDIDDEDDGAYGYNMEENDSVKGIWDWKMVRKTGRKTYSVQKGMHHCNYDVLSAPLIFSPCA